MIYEGKVCCGDVFLAPRTEAKHKAALFKSQIRDLSSNVRISGTGRSAFYELRFKGIHILDLCCFLRPIEVNRSWFKDNWNVFLLPVAPPTLLAGLYFF